jgi:hypothetical protein
MTMYRVAVNGSEKGNKPTLEAAKLFAASLTVVAGARVSIERPYERTANDAPLSWELQTGGSWKVTSRRGPAAMEEMFRF